MEVEVEGDTGTLSICHGGGSGRGYRHFIHMPWMWKGIQALYSYVMEMEVEEDTGTLSICNGDGSRRGYRHFIHMPWRWK